jgi:hypothetical protein
VCPDCACWLYSLARDGVIRIRAERSTTRHGCGRPGISGSAASSPGSPSPKVTRPPRGSLPVGFIAAWLWIGG